MIVKARTGGRFSHLLWLFLLLSVEVTAFVLYRPTLSARPPLRSPILTPFHVSSNVTEPPPSATNEGHKEEKGSSSIRPLTQNWWPVTLASAVDPSKPNAIELLDKKLVLWSDSEGQWSCLDDRCAHRFAPLSEGRVVSHENNKKCLQCAYHGWEFDGGGGCSRIPQSPNPNAKNKPSVSSYPVREGAGMIWVWADPNNVAADDSPLPISALLQRFHQVGGTARGFMRDLPYGYEFLGENLADISHLPFSHHSVGALNRQDGRPVPLQMLTKAERQDIAKEQNADPNTPSPLFQAKVINATEHDPEIVAALKNPAVKAKSDPTTASSALAFYDPSHIRYHRNPGIPGSSYEINLFMCPTTAGNSRVFLFTPFESQLPPVESSNKDNKEKDTTVEKKYQPSSVMQLSVNKWFGRNKQQNTFPPHVGHMVAHSIFDGDGIFLNKQGDRMNRAGLSFKDYHTPTSSDLMVNAHRRWLDRAAAVTRAQPGGERAARAVVGGEGVYRDDKARADMLNRYKTHTAHCKICLDALKGFQEKRNKLSMATTALVGAAGASSVLFLSTSVLLVFARLFRQSSRALITKAAATVLLSSALAMVGSLVGVRKAIREGEIVDKEINRFHFEDYIHAEKD